MRRSFVRANNARRSPRRRASSRLPSGASGPARRVYSHSRLPASPGCWLPRAGDCMLYEPPKADGHIQPRVPMTRPLAVATRCAPWRTAAVVAACASTVTLSIPLTAQSAADSARLARLPTPGRSVVATRDGIVAAAQPLAAMAGVAMLDRGGNAVDAAIAANAAMGLMEPQNSGVGGDLFALVWIAKERKLYGLNASGWAPKAMTIDWLASRGVTKLPTRGVYTVTVPGAVAGWDALRTR